MRRRKSVFWRLVPAVFASFFGSLSVAAQTEGALDCRPGGHTEKCEVQLAAGQTSELIRFRPTVPGPRAFRVQGLTEDPLIVSVHPDGTAHFSVTESAPPTKKIQVIVESVEAPLQRDTIHILPAATAREIEVQDNLARYVWTRNSWIPMGLRIGVSAAGGAQLTREECQQVRFSLQPMPEGDATPDTGRADYEPQRGSRSYTCFVNARWKLADATGEQEIGVRVGNDLVLVPGLAREGPRIVGGLALFAKHADEDTRYCNDYAQDFSACSDDRLTFADSVKKTQAGSDDWVWRPFFAVEAPLLINRQSRRGALQFIQSRIRVVAGSSFIKPTDNFFIGLTASPLYQTELESLPLQLQLAWRINGGLVGGLSVDGTALLSNALKAFGAPL